MLENNINKDKEKEINKQDKCLDSKYIIENKIHNPIYFDSYNIINEIASNLKKELNDKNETSILQKYILGIIYFRYISDKITESINILERAVNNQHFSYEKIKDEESKKLYEKYNLDKNCLLLPSNLFINIFNKINDEKENSKENLKDILNNIFKCLLNIENVNSKIFEENINLNISSKTIYKIFYEVKHITFNNPGYNIEKKDILNLAKSINLDINIYFPKNLDEDILNIKTFYKYNEVLTDNEFENLINEAKKHLGKKYVFDANGPETFDCSSFVCWSFRESKVRNMPRVDAFEIYRDYCKPILSSDAKRGDLIFFHSTYNTDRAITHIGIYLGANSVMHAGDPVKVGPLDTYYWKETFYGFARP